MCIPKVYFLRLAIVLGALAGAAPVLGATTASAASAAPGAALDGANTAWMLVSTVLVLLMTMPGIMLFYSGMLRTRNTLSIMAQTIAGIGVITVMWALVGYSLAFTPGNAWIGDLRRVMAEGLIGGEEIVLSPPTTLKDGDRIAVKAKQG